MKRRVYYFVYSKTKQKWISSVVAYMVNVMWCFMYLLRKLCLCNEKYEINIEEASQIINSVYPMPAVEYDCIQLPIKHKIDLSIIVPVYNYKEVIEECINSILNQKTSFFYEVIIVDDGSTDGAKEILKKYSNIQNVKIIYQQNKGIGGARNTGLNNAVGKYVMFVDCDDVLHLDIVESLMKVAVPEQLDMVLCGYNLVKMENFQVVEKKEFINPENGVTEKKKMGIFSYPGLPWAKVLKRELFDEIRFLNGYWYEDTIFHFLIFQKVKKYEYISKALYDYRWYENNFSHTQGKSITKSIDRYWIVIAMIEVMKKTDIVYDDKFYKVLLEHLGPVYYAALINLDESVQKAMFLQASELVKKYYKCKTEELPFHLKEIEKALLKEKMKQWKLACKYY